MNLSHPELWRRISKHRLDIPRASLSFSKRLARENGWSEAFAKSCIEEYRRFCYLATTMTKMIQPAQGCRYYPSFLDEAAQAELLMQVRAALEEAPLFTPKMPRTGKPFSVRMSNMEPLGWVSDKDGGYRYQSTHPRTDRPWPPMPQMLLDIWDELALPDTPPEACLINYYEQKARMGLHRDDDEQHPSAPVLSLSLGDTARFRLGGLKRKDPTISFELQSGEVMLLEPPLRFAYHGIDRILSGSSRLLAQGGRFNLTMRRVNP